MKTLDAVFACGLAALLITACGGSTESTGGRSSGVAPRQLASTSVSMPVHASAVDYSTVTQQLYVAYFGRPADPAGLVNFEASLQAAGAPTNIQDLIAAYKTNAGVKSLIDSFGTSAESQRLYTGDNTAFVTAVFNNILGRAPQPAGLAFWVGALDSGALSKGNAALSIMAGALNNTTAQGLADAALVNKKIGLSASFTALLDTAAEITAYKGSSAADTVRTMLSGVDADTDANAFQSDMLQTIGVLVTLPQSFTRPAPKLGQQFTYSISLEPTSPGSSASSDTLIEEVTAADSDGSVTITSNYTNSTLVEKVASDGSSLFTYHPSSGQTCTYATPFLRVPSTLALGGGGVAQMWDVETTCEYYGQTIRLRAQGTVTGRATIATDMGLVDSIVYHYISTEDQSGEDRTLIIKTEYTCWKDVSTWQDVKCTGVNTVTIGVPGNVNTSTSNYSKNIIHSWIPALKGEQ